MNNTFLTIFSCPKPFKGHAGIIQRNAIKSWTLLGPEVEIILAGDEQGTEDICREYGLKHTPLIKRNETGTPYLDSIFEACEGKSQSPFLAYVNCDIILLDDFMEAIRKISSILKGQKFLFTGSKWDLQQFDPAIFNHNGWQNELRKYVAENCRLYDAFEYFVYPRILSWNMPAFLIRPGFDNWFIYKARKLQIPVVDGTTIVNAVHQRHDHLYYLKKEQLPIESPEVRYNMKLLGYWNKYTLVHRTHMLTAGGLKEQKNDIKAFFEQVRILEIYLNYLLKRKFYPYSYPLYVILKQTKKWLKEFAGLFNRNQKEIC